MLYQITCRDTDHSSKDFESASDPITHVGGPWGPNGEVMTRTVDEVLALIAAGAQFFTQDASSTRALVEPRHMKNEPYLRTEADNSIENNLRALPDIATARFLDGLR